MEAQNKADKKDLKRSPGYPGIPLKDAIDRARTLYDKDKEHWAHIDMVMKNLGYNNPKSGSGQVAIAALKKFGLLEDEGSGPKRRARLTRLALQILLDKRDFSKEREEAIKRAALNPPIHSDLWTEYNGSLPSPDSLKYQLRMHRGFTDTGANEFVDQFYKTVEFAKLDRSDNIASEDEAMFDGLEDNMPSVATPAKTSYSFPEPSNSFPSAFTAGGGKPPDTLTIPLLGGDFAVLHARFPMSDLNWKHMMAILNAMKPALVPEVGDGDETE